MANPDGAPYDKAVLVEHEFARALIIDLPEKVRIGAFDFQIQRWNSYQAAAAQRWGECSTTEFVIRIQVDMPTRHKAVDTVLHEIMHAIYVIFGVEDDDKEERIVSMFAKALAGVYRDNPWIIEWLKKASL